VVGLLSTVIGVAFFVIGLALLVSQQCVTSSGASAGCATPYAAVGAGLAVSGVILLIIGIMRVVWLKDRFIV
jgi:hypothetical protein